VRLPAAAPKANGDAGEAGEPNAKSPTGTAAAVASGLGAAAAPNVKPPAGVLPAAASGLGAADAPNVKPTFGAVLFVNASGLPAPNEKAPVEVAAPVVLSVFGAVAEELKGLATAGFVAAAPNANGAAAGAAPGASALAITPAAPNWKVGVVLAFALSVR
jgi:hypothetical protein